MAGDWIKIEESMPEKPEVAIIADALGIDDPDTVAGKLIRVWAWATRNCNGDGVTSVTAMKQIDRCAGVSGFALAMGKAGWITVSNERLTFPNFGRHCSKTAKERALTGKRVAKNRAKTCNAATVTKTLPEKRREEYKDTNKPEGGKSKARCSLEDAISFAESIGLPASDGEACFHKWEGNGWQNGGSPIKDWKATVRSWKAAGYMPSQKQTGKTDHRKRKEDEEFSTVKHELPILSE